MYTFSVVSDDRCTCMQEKELCLWYNTNHSPKRAVFCPVWVKRTRSYLLRFCPCFSCCGLVEDYTQY